MPTAFKISGRKRPGFACIFCRSWMALSVVLTLTGSLNAQDRVIRGTVTNQFTLEKIPFASVVWKNTGRGTLTDSAGNFRVFSHNTKKDTLIISYVGYKTLAVPIQPGHDTALLQIALVQGRDVDSVVVTHTYNRGLLWWKHIVEHKAANNPYQYQSYHYDLYNKLEVDINNIDRKGFDTYKLLKPFGFILDNIDSVSDTRPFLPVFVSEIISDCYFSADPYKSRENIRASQTTGLKNETVLQFLSGTNQRINCYENFMVLFGKEFVSPISSNGNSYYNYRGADTQYISGERYLHLFFSPKRAGENTFSGDCWVHAKSWGVKQITLRLSSTASINFVNQMSIIQEFARLNDSSWVSRKDKVVAEISPLRKKGKLSLVARKTSSYSHFLVNEPEIMTMLGTNNTREQVTISDSARLRDNKFWQESRPEPLSANEEKVFKMMDTLQTIPLFKKYTNTLQFIVDGRKKLGKVEIGPWYKWMSGNQLEKFRLRFDLGTTEKFSRQLWLHGYLAYGFGDQDWKGQIEFRYKFPGDKGYFVHFSYKQDLDNGSVNDAGEGGFTMDNMFSQALRRPGIKQKFMMVSEVRLEGGKNWKSGFTVQPFITKTGYETYAPLPGKDSMFADGRNVSSGIIGLKLRYAPGEKTISTYRKDIKIKGTSPAFDLIYSKGIDGFLEGQYNFDKIHAAVSQKVRLHGWGTLNYRAYGGKIFSNALPFMLLELHPGNEVYYYNKEAFNLMNRFEFYSDVYAGINLEHNFDKKLLNLLPFMRKTNMRQFWNVKAVWGDLSKENRRQNRIDYGSYRLRTLKGEPYIEVGTGIENIFRFFRVDFVWRFAPTPTTPNGVPLPMYNNSASNFGIFGSFQFHF